MTNSSAHKPPRIFPLILGVFAVPLILGGLQLVLLGGSFYYLLTGLTLLACAIRVWQCNPAGALIYGGLMVATVAWALLEAGTNLWALLPRLVTFAVLGLWFLTPWYRRAIYQEAVPPLFASSSSRYIVVAAIVVFTYVIINGTGYSVTPLAARKTMERSTVNTATDWPSYGNSVAGTRYSPLQQINTENAAKLELAWSFRTKVGGTFKATPLQVGELLYFCTGGNVVIALDAESGELRWQFDPLIDPEHLEFARYFTTGCRGVSYYAAPPDYAGECAQRILTATSDARLIAMDALTGERCSQFGEQGEINLTIGMGNDPLLFNFQTSQPGIVRGKAVVGGWVLDNRSVGEPSGVVRAFDALSGEFAWAWDMGRPGINTQPLRGEVYTRGTPNVWSLFSVDEELGLVYAPTGNETPDYFGGQRMESSEQYASSVVAINGEDGSVRWSYQTVHHDIWDYDGPSQPVLIALTGDDGEMIPVVWVPSQPPT